MALSIKNPRADKLARQLAEVTGESLTEAIVVALEERLARERGGNRPVPLADRLLAIGRRASAFDKGSSCDGAPGAVTYDDNGLST